MKDLENDLEKATNLLDEISYFKKTLDINNLGEFIKWGELILEYSAIKRKIKIDTLGENTIVIENPRHRKTLQKIQIDRPSILDEEFEYDELDDLASGHLFSWISPAEIVKNSIKAGNLVLGIDIPKNLRIYVNEALWAFAFDNKVAVLSLCRTMIEFTMRDIATKLGKVDNKLDGADFYREYPPKKLMRIAARGNREEIKIIAKYYYNLSAIIHGFTSDHSLPPNVLRDTLDLVQSLYEKNQKDFK